MRCDLRHLPAHEACTKAKTPIRIMDDARHGSAESGSGKGWHMCFSEFEMYKNDMRGYEGTIYAKKCVLDTRGWLTHLNNNLIVFGPTGAGKSRGVVGPNIMQLNSSYVVIDPKGSLYAQYAPGLEEAGYDVQYVDFAHPDRSTHSWDPFARCAEDRDLDELGWLLMTNRGVDIKDTFWQTAGGQLVAAVATLCKEENGSATMSEVLRHLRLLTTRAESEYGPSWSNLRRSSSRSKLDELFEERVAPKTLAPAPVDPRHLSQDDYMMWKAKQLITDMTCPEDLGQSHAYDLWSSLRLAAMETWKSMVVTVTPRMNVFYDPELLRLFGESGLPPVDFASLGSRHGAVFLCVSDVSRELDGLVTLFVKQCVSELVEIADRSTHQRLLHPVRVIVDDFANMAPWPDFAKWIAGVRSREIWLTLSVQSYSQLESMYGADAETIVGNCDTRLYFAPTDLSTIKTLAILCDKEVSEVQAIPFGHIMVAIRGTGMPRQRVAYIPEEHPNWPLFERARERAQGRDLV